MSYTLLIGNENYSSWSMRAWLLLRLAGVSFEPVSIALYTSTSRAEVVARGGQSGRVPVLEDGPLAIWETLAIAEYLHERHGNVWPTDREQRARARSVSLEMATGMLALRHAMPVNLRAMGRHVVLTPELEADIERIEAIWNSCLAACSGPWLFGDYSGADVMYAPVAARFRTYAVVLGGTARAYAERLLAHPDVLEWYARAERDDSTIAAFETG